MSNCLTEVEIENAAPPLTTAHNMFSYNKKLQAISERLFENSPNLTSFSACFKYCSQLQRVHSKLLDNCSHITSYWDAYGICEALSTATLNLWNISSASNLEYTFHATPFIEDLHLVNINPKVGVSAYIAMMPQTGDGSGIYGTIHLRKNIAEAVTSFTAEDEAAANALGWTIVDEGMVTS